MMCRGSGGFAQPAVSDNSSGHGSGSTLPQARPDAAAVRSSKASSAMAKPLARKRDLTYVFPSFAIQLTSLASAIQCACSCIC